MACWMNLVKIHWRLSCSKELSVQDTWLLLSEMVIHTGPGGPGFVPLNAKTVDRITFFHESNRRHTCGKTEVKSLFETVF